VLGDLEKEGRVKRTPASTSQPHSVSVGCSPTLDNAGIT
jgi:hypothetical protein